MNMNIDRETIRLMFFGMIHANYPHITTLERLKTMLFIDNLSHLSYIDRSVIYNTGYSLFLASKPKYEEIMNELLELQERIFASAK
jgi:hypothetical protein